MRNRAKTIRRRLTAWGLLFGAGVALFVVAFFFGHHDVPMSRSYFLEKEIRNLHFQETHHPIDYARTAEHYQSLLSRIRFDNRMENNTGRYEQALARTREKARMIELVRTYEATGEVQRLAEAHALFTSADYRRLEVYDFTSIWHKGELLTEAWFLKTIREAGAGSEREPTAMKFAPDPSGGPPTEPTYETRSFLPGPHDFVAILFLWLVASLTIVTVWIGTRKLLGG